VFCCHAPFLYLSTFMALFAESTCSNQMVAEIVVAVIVVEAFVVNVVVFLMALNLLADLWTGWQNNYHLEQT